MKIVRQSVKTTRKNKIKNIITEEPEEVEETLGGNGNMLINPERKIREHKIETFEEFLNETLKFSDGEEFDTSGPLRVEKRNDGWYIIGEGKLIPVRSETDGLNTINQMIRDNA